MKISLIAINAKYIHSNPAVHILKAYCGKLGENVEISEYTINNLFETILADIYRKKPEVIAISCYIWNYELVCRLLIELPKILPNTDIWLGGPEVSYDAPKVLSRFENVTGVMVGEGEETFKELVEYYQGMDQGMRQIVEKTENEIRELSLFDIKGLCINTRCIKKYMPEDLRKLDAGKMNSDVMDAVLTSGGSQKEQTIISTGTREAIDLDSIPFFYDSLDDFENRIIYYESSRGCPFRCSYCLSSIDKHLRFRSLEKVLAELQFFLDHRVPQVKFIDRTFNCNHNHAIAIWKYISEHDNGVTNFHFEISADLITEEELEIISQMRIGLIQLEIGVQSTNEDTIREINRTMKLERLKYVVDRIHSFGNAKQHLDLIAGLPGEDLSSFVKSFNDVYAMKPDELQLGFLKVLKGSLMEEKVGEYEIKYLSTPPYEVIGTKWLSFDEILTLKKVEEMVEQYYNSGQFKYSLPYMVGLFDTPFDFFSELADFYERKGYFTNKPARMYKYDVLLEFIIEKDEELDARTAVRNDAMNHVITATRNDIRNRINVELVKELMTFDMYLREKCKSRPKFSRDLKDYKKEIYAFELNKSEHVEVFFYHVWENEISSQMIRENSPILVGFDYDLRNPLDNNAKIRWQLT